MSSPRQGKPSAVSASTHEKLNMYALAASAAGVGVLAFTPNAQAKVIYTPTKQVVGTNGVLPLDVNGDGTIDFLIQEWNNGAYTSSNALLADAAVGNGVEGANRRAGALNSGAIIGPQANFVAGDNNGEAMVSITHFTTGGTSYVHGYWVNVANKYLGLKFQIAGKTHYGWARVTVTRERFRLTATLTGYAYETTPNKAIIAGATSGDSADSGKHANSPPSDSATAGDRASDRYISLGELALGAQNFAAGRQP